MKKQKPFYTGLVKRHPDGFGFFVPDCGSIEDLYLPRRDMMGLMSNDRVQVSVQRGKYGRTRGRVQSLIERADTKATGDNSRVLNEHKIPTQFTDPKPNITIDKKDLTHRTDLTQLNFVTIDGATAKDFDDAIYVEPNTKGFRLCVAIADVSHYVKPDTVLDDEAYDRGVSTYFPRFVNPMLPSVLSDNICSLRPNEKRLVLVADLQLDFKAQLVSKKFYEAVICSQARLTYVEAQKILDQKENKKHPRVVSMLGVAGRLAQLLLKERQQRSLMIDVPESVVRLDAHGEPTHVLSVERLFSHQLIEELMLVANKAAAEFLIQHDVPCLFRVHDKPDAEALQTLASFMGQCGFKMSLKSKGLQKHISQALAKFSHTPYKQVLNILTLRSQSQAVYSQKNSGHFGLNFEKYVHFTSPIRRYPDLVVHRSIKAALALPGYVGYDASRLDSMGTWLSACEQRSVKAERQVMGIKKARFMMQHIGREFDAVISSVVKFGVFANLRAYDVDGLVALEYLPGRGYEFNETQLMLRNKKTGLKFCVGDAIKIKVLSADPSTGRIRMALA